MCLTPRMKYLGVDSTTVVAHTHVQVSVSIFEFQLNALCSRMTKSVEQGLSANSVNLTSNGWAQRLLSAGYNEPKFHFSLNSIFLQYLGQSLNQVKRAGVGQAQALNHVSALLYPMFHQLESSI